VYGWSNLGNVQVALGSLDQADESYSKAISLCELDLEQEKSFGDAKCNDLSVLFLNRGSVRLNSQMPKEALADIDRAVVIRGKPDAVLAQNRARARELNGLFTEADKDYNAALTMTTNPGAKDGGVSPFWLRAALVKFELGDYRDAYELMLRVEKRFPEAPEVRAAYATMLYTYKDDTESARKKFLEIPDRPRSKYVDTNYLTKVIAWPPAMIAGLKKVTDAVGDS